MTNETKVIIGLLTATVLIIIGGARLVSRGESSDGETVPAVQEDRLVPDSGTVLGPNDAKVTVVEFADYQCPACGTLHPVMREIMRLEADQGVRFVFRQFPLSQHQWAQLAAEAALAAREQGKFWEYSDLLFDHQEALAREDLEGYAEQLGLDMSAWRAALDEGEFKGEVQRDISDGKAIGVRSTPSIYINGVQYKGRFLVEELRVAIDAAL